MPGERKVDSDTVMSTHLHMLASRLLLLFESIFQFFLFEGVAEDPSGATDCTTQWNKQPELVILLGY